MEPSGLTEDQAGALGLFSLCCCLVVVLAMVLFVVWLVRRSGAPPAQPVAGPGQGGGGSGAMHLSVLAVGLDASVRARLEHELTQPYAAQTATQLRVMLLQRLAASLIAVQPAWRFLGYGEKDLADLGAAEQSYRANVEDFRLRSTLPADPEGTVVVLTAIVALRSPPAALTRLDDPAQLRALLDALTRVDATLLLGAEVLWAPQAGALTEAQLGQKFPEMQRLTRQF